MTNPVFRIYEFYATQGRTCSILCLNAVLKSPRILTIVYFSTNKFDNFI